MKAMRTALLSFACIAGVAFLAGAADEKGAQADKQAAQQGEMPLPPGWTMEDMQACMMAGAPGKMHEFLKKQEGVWEGKTQMWMGPGESEPMRSDCTGTNTVIMDGRYMKSEIVGEMPGMGTFNGFGLVGYDNVSQKFVGTWIDNHSTGIMQGVGEMSEDGKTLNWKYTYNCPITKKQTVMRQVETYGNNTMKMEAFVTDPKSGKEYKCMVIEFTRKQAPST